MSNREYSRPAGRCGGSGIVHSGSANANRPSVPPEVQRDMLLLADAHRVLNKQSIVRNASGSAGPSFRRTVGWFNHFCMAYNRNPNALSDNVRNFCMRVLGLTELPPLPPAEVPLGLRYLPKRPPQRPTNDEDDT